MVRCPTCGIRLAHRCCPHHGELVATPIAAEPDAPFAPLPDVPGYVVGRMLGHGGFGAVFEATSATDDQRVAIKIARSDEPSANARLVREAAALAAIGPPAVPAVRASGRLITGANYLVLEYVPAQTLAQCLAEQQGPLPPEMFATLAAAIVQLVEIAHERGFAHCDLKPENIFVGRFGDDGATGARLFDFGLAQHLSEPRWATIDQPIPEAPGAGTPEYMSPEQCEGRSPSDARTDIYALGIILYEMCCGAPPFWGTPADTQLSHRSRRPPRLSRQVPVAPALEETILRCLAKDPVRRFATAAELRATLTSALVAGGTASIPGNAAAITTARRVGAQRERTSVALVFFECVVGIDGCRSALATLGAQLAHAAGNQCAVVFGPEIGDNPTLAALQVAETLTHRGLCRRALVDLSSVLVQIRADGSRRYQGSIFRQQDRYPEQSAPEGVLLSPAAAEVLPDLVLEPVPGDPPRFLLRHAGKEGIETTGTRAGAPLVGRDDVLHQLLDSARWATTVGEPTISTVIADAGFGKSHLAAVLVRQLHSIIPPIDVMVIRAKEAFGRPGDETIREILRRELEWAESSGIAPPDFGRRLIADRIGPSAKEVWPGVAVSMGWASPGDPAVQGFAAAPGALRSATARAAGELLRAHSRRQRLAVIVDDAHFADDTALDALEFAALQESRCPLWICAMARPAFKSRRTGWGTRAARRQEVDLPALTPAAASELARRLLAPIQSVATHVLARLAARTQGIPLLLVELVRGLKRGGLLRKSEKTGAWFLATEELDRLPDLPLVEWLASTETESLPPDLIAHARIASVLGAEFTTEELEGVMAELERQGVAIESPLDPGVGLDRLRASGLLVRNRNGGVAFRHALLRDTIYRTVSTEWREQIHRAAYAYYSDRAAIPDEDRLPRVALHAARSGLCDRAATIYVDLARRAERRHAFLEAELLYGNAVENFRADGDSLRAEATRGRGLMRFRLGRFEDALKDLATAHAQPGPLGPEKEVELLLDESMVLDWLRDHVRAAALTARAEKLYEDAAATTQRSSLLDARIAFAKGRTLHRQDKEAEAAPFFATSASLAEPLGSDGYETMVQARNLLGWAYAITGRYSESALAFERNIALCESVGDMFNLTVTLQNRGILSMLLKSLDRMRADYRRMISIARENGFGLAEMAAQKDLGEVYLLAGDLAEAEREARRAIEVSRRVVGDRSLATVSAELLLARLLVFRGRREDARALSAGIRQYQQEARAAGLTECDFGPGEALMHRMVDLASSPDIGDPSVAGSAWAELLAAARAINPQPQDTVEMLEVWGLTAVRAGRSDEAVLRLGEALDLATKSAEVVVMRVRNHLAMAEAQRSH